MGDNLPTLLRDVLTDGEAEPLPDPTPRDAALAQRAGKVDAVIGMRRVGKSWLLLSRMRELLAAGVPRSRLLHVEFEDDRLADLRAQDLHLLDYVLTSGRALVLAVNKWDGLESEAKERMRAEIKRRLGFADYAELHFISALHGTGVGDLYPSIERAFASANSHWSTNRLTTILQDAVEQHQPPLVNGRRIKLRMAHQGGSNPPIIVVHGNQTASLPEAYRRYLTNTFRKVLKVRGTPLRFEFRSGKNPFDSMAGASDKEKAKKRELGRTREARKSRR